MGGELDGAAAVGVVDDVEGCGDTVLTLSSFRILKKGVHHVTFLHDAGCHDAGFLVAVTGAEEFVRSGDGAGHDGALIVARLLEMYKGISIGLRSVVLEPVGIGKNCHFGDYRTLLTELLRHG